MMSFEVTGVLDTSVMMFEGEFLLSLLPFRSLTGAITLITHN